jgi:hypothetical protein
MELNKRGFVSVHVRLPSRWLLDWLAWCIQNITLFFFLCRCCDRCGDSGGSVFDGVVCWMVQQSRLPQIKVVVLSWWLRWDFVLRLLLLVWQGRHITYSPVLCRNNTRFYVDLGVGIMPEIALSPVKFLRKFRQVWGQYLWGIRSGTWELNPNNCAVRI